MATALAVGGKLTFKRVLGSFECPGGNLRKGAGDAGRIHFCRSGPSQDGELTSNHPKGGLQLILSDTKMGITGRVRDGIDLLYLQLFFPVSSKERQESRVMASF